MRDKDVGAESLTVANIPVHSLPTPSTSGLSQSQLDSVADCLSISKAKTKKRATYTPKEKATIARYATSNRIVDTVTHFKPQFAHLTENSVRRWKREYSKISGADGSAPEALLVGKRGRPTSLPAELDADLRRLLVTMREAGGVVNSTTIRGCLMGLVNANLTKYGTFLKFEVTHSWLTSLYTRMKFSQRKATTSRPPVSSGAYEETKLRYHFALQKVVDEYDIPEELIITLDQTPTKFFNLSNSTMSKRGESRTAVAHCGDKRTITATLAVTLSGDILPYQLIYKGTTKRCLPSADLLPAGFLLSYNKTHWSNTEETLNILNNVIKPYVDQKKKSLGKPDSQKVVVIWDDFSAHNAPRVLSLLSMLGICTVDIPKNLTHLLSPLDLTVNKKLKDFEREACASYVSRSLADHIQHNPEVGDFKLDIRLSVLKPLHAKTLTASYEFFKTVEGKKLIASGWRASGLTEAVRRCKEDGIDSRMLIDPFAALRI